GGGLGQAEEPRASGLGPDLVEVGRVEALEPRCEPESAFAAAKALLRDWAYPFPALYFSRFGLARVGDHLVGLGPGLRAGRAEISNDEGWCAEKAEAFGGVIVAREHAVDRLGIRLEVFLCSVDIDAGAREQFMDARLGQPRADADDGVMRLLVFVLVFA